MVVDVVPAPSPPQAGESQRLKMSYQEFLAWSDEDTHAEWVNGEVIIAMPPATLHQMIAGFLFELISLFVRFFHLGQVLPTPFEMKLSPDGPSREPDILFIANEHLDWLTPERLQGPADLVIEIVSDDSVTRDRVDKFDEYEECGVREYWIIDPRPHRRRAEFYVRDERGQFQPVRLDRERIYRSTVVPGFWLRVDWLWAGELADPQFTFAEIAGFPSEVVAALQAIRDSGVPKAKLE
jgi:Uma2 family endonuclease